MSLLQTEVAIAELAANTQMGQGSHLDGRIRSGLQGIVIGEVPFDPALHSPWDINPLSLMAEVYGTPHVQLVMPGRPLEANIVVDLASDDHPKVAVAKTVLAAELERSLSSVVVSPAVTNRVYKYATGGSDRADAVKLNDIEVIDSTKDAKTPLQRATEVAHICTQGLTFVIGDFRRLPLHEVPHADYQGTIGIKVNHASERSIPAGRGVVSLGGLVEVDTRNPAKLKAINDTLQARHEAKITALKAVGITTVSMVVHPGAKYGFDQTDADQHLSAAVKSLY